MSWLLVPTEFTRFNKTRSLLHASGGITLDRDFSSGV